MAELDALQAQVDRTTTVDESVKALLTGLSAKIQALVDAAASTGSVDPAALQGLVDTLKTNTDALADAVAANTPAA